MPLICPTKKRGAFTLVELTVVIAVLGLMAALLLPAIQAARESSRAAACRNNLKQIGIALIHYESVYKQFPEGVEGRLDLALFPTSMFGMSWWARILPYLEQADITD